MNSPEEINRYEQVAKYFSNIDKEFKIKSMRYAGTPKVAIHVFNNDIKEAIAKGASLKKFGPDFSIVKNPEISSSVHDQVIDFNNKTQFSLWRILNEQELLKQERKSSIEIIFPFTPVRKHGKVIRTPEFRLPPLDCWEIVSPLLVR